MHNSQGSLGTPFENFFGNYSRCHHDLGAARANLQRGWTDITRAIGSRPIVASTLVLFTFVAKEMLVLRNRRHLSNVAFITHGAIRAAVTSPPSCIWPSYPRTLIGPQSHRDQQDKGQSDPGQCQPSHIIAYRCVIPSLNNVHKLGQPNGLDQLICPTNDLSFSDRIPEFSDSAE